MALVEDPTVEIGECGVYLDAPTKNVTFRMLPGGGCELVCTNYTGSIKLLNLAQINLGQATPSGSFASNTSIANNNYTMALAQSTVDGVLPAKSGSIQPAPPNGRKRGRATSPAASSQVSDDTPLPDSIKLKTPEPASTAEVTSPAALDPAPSTGKTKRGSRVSFTSSAGSTEATSSGAQTASSASAAAAQTPASTTADPTLISSESAKDHTDGMSARPAKRRRGGAHTEEPDAAASTAAAASSAGTSPARAVSSPVTSGSNKKRSPAASCIGGGSAISASITAARTLDFASQSGAAASASSATASRRGARASIMSAATAAADAALATLIQPGSGDSESARSLTGALVAPLSVTAGTATAPIPPARWGHAAAVVHDAAGPQMLLYGGQASDGAVLADSYLLDLSATAASGGYKAPATWKAVESGSCTAQPRVWHTAVSVPDVSLILAFGEVGNGADAGGKKGSAASSAEASADDQSESLSVFDPSVPMWYPINPSGKLPSRRSGHSLVLVRNGKLPTGHASALQADSGADPLLVLFGGLRRSAGRDTWLNDLYAMSMSNYKWHGPIRTLGKAPMPRCYHAAVALGNRMVVFGGNNGAATYSDISVLECAPAVSNTDMWTWTQPTLTGTGRGPKPRTGATATAIGDRYILIAGGWDRDEADTLAAEARARAKAHGKSSSACDAAAAAAVTVKPGQRQLGSPFHDVWLLDCLNWEWIRVETDAAAGVSCSRVGHSAVLLSPGSGSGSSGPAVLLYGGMRSDETCSAEAVVLQLPAELWAAAQLPSSGDDEGASARDDNDQDEQTGEDDWRADRDSGRASVHSGLARGAASAGGAGSGAASSALMDDDPDRSDFALAQRDSQMQREVDHEKEWSELLA